MNSQPKDMMEREAAQRQAKFLMGPLAKGYIADLVNRSYRTNVATVRALALFDSNAIPIERQFMWCDVNAFDVAIKACDSAIVAGLEGTGDYTKILEKARLAILPKFLLDLNKGVLLTQNVNDVFTSMYGGRPISVVQAKRAFWTHIHIECDDAGEPLLW